MGLKKEIEKYKTQSVCVKIIRKSKMRTIHGFILDNSDKFILLQEVDDFLVVGYMIVPKKSIKEIRFNDFDKAYDEMFKAEKEFENISLKHKIDLTNWQTILKSIKLTGLNQIIDCEKDDLFLIGVLGNIQSDTAYIRYINASGILDNIETIVVYKQITRVEFDDRYTKTFSKHLKYSN